MYVARCRSNITRGKRWLIWYTQLKIIFNENNAIILDRVIKTSYELIWSPIWSIVHSVKAEIEKCEYGQSAKLP